MFKKSNRVYKRKFDNLSSLLSTLTKRITGMIARNSSLAWGKFLDRMFHPVLGTTKNNIKAYRAVGKFLWKLHKSGGLPYIVKYLKACSVLLQQSVGGYKTPSQALGAAVATTRGGLPRIIPREFRDRIRARDTKVIRMWLTLFNIYRIIEIPGVLKLSTITDPGVEFDISKMTEFREIFYHYLLRKNKALSQFKLSLSSGDGLKAKPFLIAKSSPTTNFRMETDLFDTRGVRIPGDASLQWNYSSTSPISLIIASVLIKTDTVLYPIFRDWCEKTGNEPIIQFVQFVSYWIKLPRLNSSYFHMFLSDKSTLNWYNDKYTLGKLGFKLEAAGKVRVFAMVDCITQWLLRPLHDALFSILKLIPQDGTFDQHAPIHLLYEKLLSRNGWNLYSFDLSAATDRLPVAIQESLLDPILGTELSTLWRRLLTWRGYKAQSTKFKVDDILYYAVGQPMGALSSWAMLALTHHFIVQWAWWRSRRDKTLSFSWFEMYAILGDDIVIADDRVAKEYLIIMKELGVDINLAKSLISRKRVCEFAKMYWTPEDASPLPFKEFLLMERNSSALMEYAKKYSLSLPDIFHSLGYGYKTKASLYTKKLVNMGPRVRRILVALTEPGSYLGKDLRSWLTMDSLSRSSDHSNWDRVAQSIADTEIPYMIDRVKRIRDSLRLFTAQGLAQSGSKWLFDSQKINLSGDLTTGKSGEIVEISRGFDRAKSTESLRKGLEQGVPEAIRNQVLHVDKKNRRVYKLATRPDRKSVV